MHETPLGNLGLLIKGMLVLNVLIRLSVHVCTTELHCDPMYPTLLFYSVYWQMTLFIKGRVLNGLSKQNIQNCTHYVSSDWPIVYS